ncbi:MAG: aspartate/glutamate racemase family protein, partial [bacterium]
MISKGRLGIIGGMGSVAAAYFFKRLVELTPATTDQDYVETFI